MGLIWKIGAFIVEGEARIAHGAFDGDLCLG